MDYPAEYCQIRKGLEAHASVLVARFSALTSNLSRLIGNHDEWAEAYRECRTTQKQLGVCKARLVSHRAQHHC